MSEVNQTCIGLSVIQLLSHINYTISVFGVKPHRVCPKYTIYKIS